MFFVYQLRYLVSPTLSKPDAATQAATKRYAATMSQWLSNQLFLKHESQMALFISLEPTCHKSPVAVMHMCNHALAKRTLRAYSGCSIYSKWLCCLPLWLSSCHGFRAHVAVMFFLAMVHAAKWL